MITFACETKLEMDPLVKYSNVKLNMKRILSQAQELEWEREEELLVKWSNKNNLKEKVRQQILQEIMAMQGINHKNVLRLLECKKSANNIYIFTELCNGGDLRRFLELKNEKLDEKLVKIIIQQIAEGLSHLNENQILHRDLKLDNIFLNFPNYKVSGIVPDSYIEEFDHEMEEIEIIIGDLGFARSLENKALTKSNVGTPLNMAPEIMNGDYYNSKVDIWSLGTMMYELLVGFTPFIGISLNDLK